MALQLLSASIAATLLILVTTIIVLRHRLSASVFSRAVRNDDDLKLDRHMTELSGLISSLASALPNSVVLPQDTFEFKKSLHSYWAQQECEVIPACVVRPESAQQLSTIVTILKQEYHRRTSQAGQKESRGFFAVRSGGHSPVPGAASVEGGIVIDLCRLREVTTTDNGTCTTIGAGCRWIDVSSVLDKKGLAVVGGRNSAVGVGGLTLGGGLSFFSPGFGLVCSNVISYEIVPASGAITTASASFNPDLWRALKGGSNNFGIVTSFTVSSFPSANIWSGFLYMPTFQAAKVLSSFHEFVNNTRDEYAAGPIACFSYIQQLGVQAIAVNLVHTNPPEDEKKWPSCWRASPFSRLWRLWSTCKVRTLTSATDEVNALNPPGRRQVFATTTIKNDLPTLTTAHLVYYDAVASLRAAKVKDLVWTLVLQPLLPKWSRKGDPNPLGLQEGSEEPLVVLNFTVNWNERQHDEIVTTATRRAVEQIEAKAIANGTSHRYRYLNYCAEWQKPFEGYGEENWRFLQGVSKKYDPAGLFQRGCTGGFKLDLDDGQT